MRKVHLESSCFDRRIIKVDREAPIGFPDATVLFRRAALAHVLSFCFFSHFKGSSNMLTYFLKKILSELSLFFVCGCVTFIRFDVLVLTVQVVSLLAFDHFNPLLLQSIMSRWMFRAIVRQKSWAKRFPSTISVPYICVSPQSFPLFPHDNFHSVSPTLLNQSYDRLKKTKP